MVGRWRDIAWSLAFVAGCGGAGDEGNVYRPPAIAGAAGEVAGGGTAGTSGDGAGASVGGTTGVGGECVAQPALPEGVPHCTPDGYIEPDELLRTHCEATGESCAGWAPTGPDPCRQAPNVVRLVCCGWGYWRDSVCPTLSPGSDAACELPIVDLAPCPKTGLECEVNVPGTSRLYLCCPDGTWRSGGACPR